MEDKKAKGSKRTKGGLWGESDKRSLYSRDQDRHVGASLSCVLPFVIFLTGRNYCRICPGKTKGLSKEREPCGALNLGVKPQERHREAEGCQ